VEHFSATCAKCGTMITDIQEAFNYCEGVTVYAKCHGDIHWISARDFRRFNGVLFTETAVTRNFAVQHFKENLLR
jgi:hypothetical protein